MTEQRDWSQLPGDLLDTIGRRLTKPRDLVRFQAVCKPWREAVPEFRRSLPWLVASCKSMKRTPDCAGFHRLGCHRFIDVAAENDKNLEPIIHINLAGDDNVKCLGSAFGWLLLAERPRRPRPWVALHLLNPLTREKIPLPEKTEQGDYLLDSTKRRSIRRFAMSADPTTTTKECFVAVLFCNFDWYLDAIDRDDGLAFCKLGARKQRWTYPCVDRTLVSFRPAEIVFWRDELHMFCHDTGRVWAVDHDRDQQSMFSLAFVPKDLTLAQSLGYKFCLVVSPEGELMLLKFGRTMFSLYKVNEDEKSWDKVESIGDYALFYDLHSAIYVSVENHPKGRRNCVYYEQNIYDLNVELFVNYDIDNRSRGDWLEEFFFLDTSCRYKV